MGVVSGERCGELHFQVSGTSWLPLLWTLCLQSPLGFELAVPVPLSIRGLADLLLLLARPLRDL